MAPVLLELKQQAGKDIEFVTMDVSYAAPGLSKNDGSQSYLPNSHNVFHSFQVFLIEYVRAQDMYNISTDEDHLCWNAGAFKRPWVGSTLPRNLQNDFWARKLGVDGLPHVAFIDSQRHVQTALVGDVPANVVRADVEALIKGAEMPFIMYDAFEGQSNKIEWITLTTRWWPNRSHLFGIIWRGLKRLKILMSATPVVYFEIEQPARTEVALQGVPDRRADLEEASQVHSCSACSDLSACGGKSPSCSTKYLSKLKVECFIIKSMPLSWFVIGSQSMTCRDMLEVWRGDGATFSCSDWLGSWFSRLELGVCVSYASSRILLAEQTWDWDSSIESIRVIILRTFCGDDTKLCMSTFY